MSNWKATACAMPNIAFLKYWGNADESLRIPVNGSISMNLDGLLTRTTVTFSPDLDQDTLTIDGQNVSGIALNRVSYHLNHIRKLADSNYCASVESTNNFPSGAGIASSASAFAALTLAAATALNLKLSERQLSSIARLGSGSASRSIPGGYVEWYAGSTHEDSYAESIAPANYWALTDFVAVVSKSHKKTGSSEGHTLAPTSVLQNARVHHAAERLERCRTAILSRDFTALADVVELDSNLMHAVMMTSTPPLFYWQPQTLALMQAVREWRAEGIQVLYTIDAGPNVHCICAPGFEDEVYKRLNTQPGVVDVLKAVPGGPAYIAETS
jgi:diphosphomevalonate decarboxylase